MRLERIDIKAQMSVMNLCSSFTTFFVLRNPDATEQILQNLKSGPEYKILSKIDRFFAPFFLLLATVTFPRFNGA